MISKQKTANYFRPESLSAALDMADKAGENFRFLAGGTDLLVNQIQEIIEVETLIDLSGIEELKGIHHEKDKVSIGPLTTIEEVFISPIITEKFPALAEAARAVASPVIRKTATLGGNLFCENRCVFYNQSAWWREAAGLCLKCNGDICIATGGKKACFSKFVSDTAPVLIALEASVEVYAGDRKKEMPVKDLYSSNGLSPINLSPKDLLTRIFIPLSPTRNCVFKKLRPRQAVDFTSLTTSVSLSSAGEIIIAIGGVDPGPVVLSGLISDNPEKLISNAAKKCRIVDNDIYGRIYRKEMISVFISQSIKQLLDTK